MDRRKAPAWDEEVDLNDSDETFYEPDFNKHPEEARCLDGDLAGSEAVDAYFERTYCMNGDSLRASHDLGTEETYFSPAEQARRGAVHRALQPPDTDETFFEPGERHAVWDAPLPDQRRPEHRAVLADSRVVPETPPAMPAQGLDDEQDEAFYEDDGDLGILAEGMVPAQGHGEGAGAEDNSLFTHDCDLEWSQFCWGPGDHQPGASNVDNDVYLQIPDPLTQELHNYKVPGLRADDPESLSAFTQDFASWAQQAQLCPPRADSGAAAAAAMPLEMTQCTQDLEWTQTQNFEMARADSQAMDASSAGAPEGLTMASHTPAPGPAAASSSQDQFMDAVVPQSRPPQVNSSSMESSDSNNVPSIPSFEDDAAPPPCLPPEDLRNMEELTASFRNISFCLEEVEAVVTTMMHEGLPDRGAAPAPAVPQSQATLPPRAKVDTNCLQPSQGPRSPTFSTHPRRRGRRPRPHARTDSSNSSSGGQVQHAQPPASAPAPSSPVLGRGRTPGRPRGKRKRSGPAACLSQGQHQLRRSQSAAPTCSPSSPPQSKARRTTEAATRTSSQGRSEMIPLYARLQELRFFMHDVVRGREPLPTSEEVSQLSSEVSSIECNIKQALTFDVTTKQIKLKREEALQVADKILHQLGVLAQMQENSGATNEDNVLGSSWSNIASINLCEFTPAGSSSQSKFYSQGRNCEDIISKLQESETTSINPNTLVNRGMKSGIFETVRELEVAPHIKQSHSRKAPQEIQYTSDNEKGPNSGLKLNETVIQESQQSSNEGELITQEKYGQENKRCNYACDIGHPTGFQENVVLLQTNTVLKTADVCVHCTCKSSKGDTLQKSSGVQTDCDLSTSQLNDTQLFTYNGVPNSSCSSNTENSDLHTITELPISSTSFQEREIISTDKPGLIEEHQEEEVNTEMCEYQNLVSLIKLSSEIARTHPDGKRKTEDYVWRGGPLKLTGVLLPKSSEFSPINDLPPNFWDDPQAPVPEEWVNMLEWED